MRDLMPDNAHDSGYKPTSARKQSPNGPDNRLGRGLDWLDFASGANRHLLFSMVRSNIRIKYQSSILGFAWTLLSPLLMLGLLIIVFSHVVRIPIEDFWAFLVSGFFVWNYVNMTINYGAQSLEEHSSLVKNYSFPSETPLIAGALSRLVEFSFELIVIVVILAVFHHGTFPASFLLLPLLVTLMFLLILGPMYLVCTAAVFNEDLKHALPIIFTALFYATPIFYNIELVPESMRWFFYLNPIALIVMCFQMVLYDGVFPPIWLLLWLVVTAVGLDIIGYRVFRRYRGQFAELV